MCLHPNTTEFSLYALKSAFLQKEQSLYRHCTWWRQTSQTLHECRLNSPHGQIPVRFITRAKISRPKHNRAEWTFVYRARSASTEEIVPTANHVHPDGGESFFFYCVLNTYMAQEAELVVFPPEAAVVSAGWTALPWPAHTHIKREREITWFYTVKSCQEVKLDCFLFRVSWLTDTQTAVAAADSLKNPSCLQVAGQTLKTKY